MRLNLPFIEVFIFHRNRHGHDGDFIPLQRFETCTSEALLAIKAKMDHDEALLNFLYEKFGPKPVNIGIAVNQIAGDDMKNLTGFVTYADGKFAATTAGSGLDKDGNAVIWQAFDAVHPKPADYPGAFAETSGDGTFTDNGDGTATVDVKAGNDVVTYTEGAFNAEVDFAGIPQPEAQTGVGIGIADSA